MEMELQDIRNMTPSKYLPINYNDNEIEKEEISLK